MSEKQNTDVTNFTDLVRNLPDPVQAGLLKTLGTLLGGVMAIPAELLRRQAQAIADTTAARSLVASEIAKGVVGEALKDPILMQTAAEMYLPTAVRKVRNRAQVAERCMEHIADKSTDGATASAPADDWMNAFIRFSEDASSEHLQDLFGRILAGELVRSGSFSPSTLRTISELDQTIAQDFSLVWAKSVGDSVDYSADFKRGEWFSRWKRLADVGLMRGDVTAQYLPEFQPKTDGYALWSPMTFEKGYLLLYFSQNCRAKWEHIEFTRTGRELGSIIAAPDYKANIRDAGQGLKFPGIFRIKLHSYGKPPDLLYREPISS